MNRLLEAVLRLVVRFKYLLRAHPRLAPIYARVSRQAANRRAFSGIPVHEWMLADRARVDTYQRAIARHVRPGDTVIDLGTGSGILAFFAAQQGAQVLAVDHADIIEVARRVAEGNGLRNIEFIKSSSTDLTLAERVDVIVHEQIGMYVFDENMVASVTDLRDRLLKPTGRILPSRFEVFLEPVKLKDEYRVPLLWEQTIHGVSFASLRDWYESSVHRTRFSSVRQQHIDYLLGEPERVLAFDLMTVREGDLPRTLRSVRTVARSGRLDGFCFYFQASFDDEIALGNSPADETTSWVMPVLRVPARMCAGGQAITCTLSMPQLNAPGEWHWTCEVQ